MRRRIGPSVGPAGGVPRLPLATFGVALLVAGALLAGDLFPHSPPTAAQSAVTAVDPRYFPQTGYRVGDDRLWEFFLRRGGVRTFGYPISGAFTLLGQPVQLFQRHALHLRPDGGVGTLNLLEDGLLPATRIDGATVPAPDPDLLRAAPRLHEPDYHARALRFVEEVVPDTWRGRPVNFRAALLHTVRPEDAFPDGLGEPGLLPGFALELWGLPTSRPAADPADPARVYQRFQRGILRHDAGCDCTGALPLGEWFKRVLLGSGPPTDLPDRAAGSRFYAQYDPAAPSGVARPAELPGTVLAGAFGAEVGLPTTAGLPAPGEPTPWPTGAPGAELGSPPAPGPAATPWPEGGTPPPAETPLPAATPWTPEPFPRSRTWSDDADAATSSSSDGCRGDEELRFAPERPRVGGQLTVTVESARRHDPAVVRLDGPIPSGPVTERPDRQGWIGEWTVTPTAAGRHEFTVSMSGEPCASAAVRVLPESGAAATSTPTRTATAVATGATATATPGRSPTRTPTPSPVIGPAPRISDFDPPTGPSTGARCGGRLTVTGANFGAAPDRSGGELTFGGRRPAIVAWRDAAITFVVPSGLDGGEQAVVISTAGGEARNRDTLRAGGCR